MKTSDHADSNIDVKINFEKNKLIHQNAIISIPIDIILASILTWQIYPYVDQKILFYWYPTFLFISFVRILLNVWYFHTKSDSAYQKLHYYLFISAATLTALLWGIAGSVLMAHDIARQFLTMVILAGVTAGAMLLLVPSYLAASLYATCLLIPFVIWAVLQTNHSIYYTFAITVTIYWLFLLILGRHGHNVITKNLKLTFENIKLIQNISESNMKLANFNQTLLESEERFRQSFENASIGMALVSIKGNWLKVNYSLCTILGYTEKELLNMTFQDITYQEDLSNDLQHVQQLLEGMISSYHMEKRYIRKDGQIIWTLLSVALIKDQNQTPLYFIAQIQDIHAQKNAEAELRESNIRLSSANSDLARQTKELQQHQQILERLSELGAVFSTCVNEAEVYIHFSEYIRKIFGKFSGTLAIFTDSTKHLQYVVTWGEMDLSKKDIFLSTDCWALRQGQPYIFPYQSPPELRCNHINIKNSGYRCIPLIASGQMLGILSITTGTKNLSIEQEKMLDQIAIDTAFTITNVRLRHSLEQISAHDPITGLYNRHYLDDVFTKLIIRAKQKNSKISIMVIKINDIQKLIETFNVTMESILIEFSNLLKQMFKNNDYLFHCTNDSFAVLLNEMSYENAASYMPSLQHNIDAIQNNKMVHHIKVSMGIATFPEHGTTADELINAAYRNLQDTSKILT